MFLEYFNLRALFKNFALLNYDNIQTREEYLSMSMCTVCIFMENVFLHILLYNILEQLPLFIFSVRVDFRKFLPTSSSDLFGGFKDNKYRAMCVYVCI